MNDLRTAANQTTPWWHGWVGRLLGAFVCGVRLLPDPLAYFLADLLVPVQVLIVHATRGKSTRKRRGFDHNVRIVFRDRLTARQRRRLLWAWARHMVHLGVDTCKMPGITAENVGRFCDLADMAVLRAQVERGRGVIGASGHVGVYEYASHLIALHGIRIVTIFRPSPIRPVTDVINRIRASGGQEMTERNGAVRQMMRAVREGAVTGIIADVSSKESEIFAPFLGTPAATNNTVGMLHLKTGAPILVMTTQRTGRRRYKFHVWDVIEAEESGPGADDPGAGDRDAALARVARRMNDALSRAIREYPEQWFWDSRRFRNRPAGEVLDPSGLPPQSDPDQAIPAGPSA